jgi:hypothetical protein
MNEFNQDLSIKTRIDNRLERIAKVLLLNASFIDNPGLFSGKTGIAIFLYHYGRFSGHKIYTDYAGELVDEIYEGVNMNASVNFTTGLTGIGWGIEYLVKNGFVDANTDEALEDVDNFIYRSNLRSSFLLENRNDHFGYGFYYLSRLRGKEEDDSLKTLFKKQHIIYLSEECERILVQKLLPGDKIKFLGTESLNSVIWFLLEIYRLGLFPKRVEKLFQALPEFIDECLKHNEDNSGKMQLCLLTSLIIDRVRDNESIRKLKRIIKNNQLIMDVDLNEELLLKDFGRSLIRRMIYIPYSNYDNQSSTRSEKMFSILDNEESWNRILDNLNKNNLGLLGFAGFGLGIIFDAENSSESSVHKTQSE